jgi:hypothetical protein
MTKKTDDEVVVDTEDEIMSEEDFDLEDMFGTDSNLEVTGVPVKLGKTTFTLARAGGSNTAFTRAMAKKTMPYRRLLQGLETDPNKISDKLLRLMRKIEMEVYAETCVKGWTHDDLGKNKCYGKAKEVLQFSPDNVLKLFNQMPPVFDALSERAKDLTTFRDAVEADAKN